VQEQIDPFAANDATHKEKNKLSTTLRARERAFRCEYFGIVAVWDDSNSFCLNAASNENIPYKIRWNPQLINVLTNLLDPNARRSTVFPREDNGKLTCQWAAKIGWPLMPNG
jgi:hypothetical protein